MLKIILIAAISLILAPNKSYSLDISTYGIENDLIPGTDYYYTNGFFYRFHDKSMNDSWVFWPINFDEKSINSIEFVQQIHTPFATRKKVRPEGDHPYVGKLFIRLASNNQSERVSSKYQLTLGILGPNSGSKFVQNFFHQILPASKVEGWSGQVKNDYLLNYDLNYAISLMKFNYFTIHMINNYHLGSNYTGASAGMTMTFGDHSYMFFDYHRLKNIELGKFLFRIGIQRDYMVYDSSLMGGVNNDREKALSYYQLEKLIEHGTAELQYTWARLTLKLSHHTLSERIIGGKKHEYTGIYFTWRD